MIERIQIYDIYSSAFLILIVGSLLKSPQDTFMDESGEIPNAGSPNKPKYIEELCNTKDAQDLRAWIFSYSFSNLFVSIIQHRMKKTDRTQITFIVRWL